MILSEQNFTQYLNDKLYQKARLFYHKEKLCSYKKSRLAFWHVSVFSSEARLS